MHMANECTDDKGVSREVHAAVTLLQGAELAMSIAQLVIGVVLGHCLCPPSVAGDRSVDWQRVSDAAGWQPRDSQGELVYNDQIWIFGGWFDSYHAPPRDVWSSRDGKDWTLITREAPWKHSDLPMAVVFQDKMWLMGGWYNGRLPGHSASNAVWSSTDGEQWDLVTTDAGWSPRLASALVAFQDKMWILGGTENYFFGDEQSLKNDVWHSTDGQLWSHATADAGWTPRAYHQAVVLNERMYVLGGGNYRPTPHVKNDVWSSADGVEWIQETAAAPWQGRAWFSATVYRDRMWVIGGWSDSPWQNLGDVWYSQNGREWTRLESDIIWKERHEHSVFVFQDKLWVAGGHAQPLNSEVWSLDIPADALAGE
jgi:hypothetical protein